MSKQHAPHTRSDPRGQVLVIVAFGLFTLIAVAAIVVDLGFSWMLHRQEQNAADPAALAAARWIPDINATGDPTYGPGGPDQQSPPGLMWQEACAAARQNGFFMAATSNTGCTPANDGDRAASLKVYWPPRGSAAGDYAGQPQYVQVVIKGQHPAFFARLFGQDTASVVSSAVAANSTGDSNPYALVALDPGNYCGAGKISGSGQTSTFKVSVGGDVHVNSTCGQSETADGACAISSGGGMRLDGGGELEVDNGADAYVSGSCKGQPDAVTFANSSGSPGAMTEQAVQIGDPLGELPAPPFTGPGGCNGAPATSQCRLNGGTNNLTPGVFYGGIKITGPNTQVNLQPGIYIMAGGGISQQNGYLTAVSGNVLIYGTDDPAHAADCKADWSGTSSAYCQQMINLNGGSSLQLSGITSGPYKGLVIWQDGNASCPVATCPIRLGGQDNLNVSGTIYAPDQEVILDGGSSGTGVASVQIISWHWTITGNAQLSMPYNPDALYHLAMRGLVH